MTTAASVQAPSEAAPAVEVANASRWYGNVVAVNDVTFRLEGGITGLLGPNGAGKSTILHMIAGFLAPSSGSVTVAGSPTRGHPELYRRIGLVPEAEAVYPFLTGRQFVVANARLQGMSGEQAVAAAARAIDHVDLGAAQDRAIGTYSKGMRQRIKVASALVHDPPVLLLDEPFNGMDPRQRLQMMDLLRQHGPPGPRDPVLEPHPGGGGARRRAGAGDRGRPPGRVRRLPRDPSPDDGPAAHLHRPLLGRPGAGRGADARADRPPACRSTMG